MMVLPQVRVRWGTVTPITSALFYDRTPLRALATGLAFIAYQGAAVGAGFALGTHPLGVLVLATVVAGVAFTAVSGYITVVVIRVHVARREFAAQVMEDLDQAFGLPSDLERFDFDMAFRDESGRDRVAIVAEIGDNHYQFFVREDFIVAEKNVDGFWLPVAKLLHEESLASSTELTGISAR